jgi:putative heme-binding domain-containing protein
LEVLFGSGRALEEVRQTALDAKADISARRQALESLVSANPPDLRATLETLLKDGELVPAVLAALAKFDDAAGLIVANYHRARADGKPAVITALCSRPVYARALLEAMAAGKIPRADLTPYHARQIAALGDADVSRRLAEVWGTVATTSGQKKARMAELKKELAPEVLKEADIAAGRAVFTQTCAACHTLYDLGQQGANLGPNLTGSGRENVDYLLENIVDPSALVPADYKLSVLTMKDGRALSGFISTQNDQTLTLRTMTSTETLPRAEVTKTETSAQSLMPEGLLDTLTPQQRRDLFGFLMKK